MSYTLRQLVLDAMNWLLRHPKALFPITTPITKAHIRTAYNSQNGVTTFDADLLARVRTLDTANVYSELSDAVLSDNINSAVTEDENLSNIVSVPGEPD